MRRWIVISSAVVCTGILYTLVSNVLAARAERKREAVFQQTLLSYQRALKTGMTREQVERCLRSMSVQFQRSSCCANTESRAADLVKIGEGPKLWYCSENTEYLAFQFTTPGTAVPDSKDVLDKLTLYQWPGGCL